ncbi:GNAT family N-acetyltransferase [Gayadomonas joobiniege]|uniref:GNAT family N-acetyltransferase n=1 Tax=Gayadomonas joobiniege TaxID=1234606 RepID=UPI000370E852|nr:GNAT family N-acetyltransferase [Gayadomonas joobiniege]
MPQISNLINCPQHLPQLARWHHAEWGYLNPERTFAQRIAEMQADLQQAFVPSTWVCLLNEFPIGSASLIVNDMDSHPELSPWLASVYVHPQYRNQGIGSTLVKHLMVQAKRRGLTDLYLFTPDAEAFYLKLDWVLLSRELYRDEPVSLMKTSL